MGVRILKLDSIYAFLEKENKAVDIYGYILDKKAGKITLYVKGGAVEVHNQADVTIRHID